MNAESKIKLRAEDGSMYNATIESAGIVDRLKCKTHESKEYCELEIESNLPNVRGGEFDRVQVVDIQSSTTHTPTQDNFNSFHEFHDSFAYCADVSVEVEDGWDDLGSPTRELVCVDSDLL